MNIQPYSEADFESLVEAMASFQDYIASLDPLQHTRQGKDFDAPAYLRVRIAESRKEGGVFLLAKEQSTIVGLISGRLVEVPEASALDEYVQKTGEVTELYVREDQRGKKVGTALMQAVERHFIELGCKALLVDCFAPNTLAHQFYERYGFTDRMIMMRKELE